MTSKEKVQIGDRVFFYKNSTHGLTYGSVVKLNGSLAYVRDQSGVLWERYSTDLTRY